jgi:hypothetical protein
MSKPLNFVMLHHHVIDAPAWRDMSHGARSLYVSLKRRWFHNRKNLVYLSERTAAKELRSHRNYIRRWFRELQYYGFIVMERPGYLGLEGKGRAAHYRLTECDTFAPKGSLAPTIQATRDFDRWNGVRFSGHQTGGDRLKPKTESRTPKGVHLGLQKGSRGGLQKGSTPAAKRTTKGVHTARPTGLQKGSISVTPSWVARAGFS